MTVILPPAQTEYQATPAAQGRAAASSVQLDVGVDDHLLPHLELGLERGGALAEAGAARLDAELCDRVAEIGVLEHLLVDRRVERRQHVGRDASGRKDAEPEIDREPLDAGLVDRRQIRIDADPLEA